MATLDQMIRKTRPVTTQAGAKYTLLRPNLVIRQKYLEFTRTIGRFEEIIETETVTAENVQKATEDLITGLIDLLEFWLKKTHPDITREQIMEDWDTSDLAMIKVLVADFEAEIEGASPPVSGNREERRAAAKKSQ